MQFIAVYKDDQDDKMPRYIRTIVVDKGSSGRFLDKSWNAVDIPRGLANCTVSKPGGGTETFLTGIVYLSYTTFTGSGTNNAGNLYITRSMDCGATWAKPNKLSASIQVIQSANVAINPNNGNVYVTWRQFATSNAPNAIWFTSSTNFGQTYGKPISIADLGPATASKAPDQGSLPGTGDLAALRMFRTNSYPSMCVNSDNRIRIVWSQRPKAPADAQDPNASGQS